MQPAAPATTPKPARPKQPTFWQQYSPHGECQFSFVGSLTVHVIFLGGFLLAVLFFLDIESSEISKPPQMDAVEIEGAGGGLGGYAKGPGANSEGAPGKAEGVPRGQSGKQGAKNLDIPKDFEFSELPSMDLVVGAKDSTGEVLSLDKQLANAEAAGRRYMESLAQQGSGAPDGMKGGEKDGKGGGAGQQKGGGLGNLKGDTKGNSPVGGKGGGKSNEHVRRALRWHIKASYDGEEHLKKLSGLKATLIIPLTDKGDDALWYDMSRYDPAQPRALPPSRRAPFAYDPQKVLWVNRNPTEMATLAKQLGLDREPKYTIIVLAPEVERQMAVRELEYAGKQEWEIQLTTWDIGLRDGVYEPYIVDQKYYGRGR
jgi:hypothetical protein